ncbi:hypothetical protein ACI65C_013380 [Semiaphis heraclei]
MPSCFICGRTRNSGSKDLGISFHQIPKNEKYREQWLDFIRKFETDDKTIKSRSVVCSEHFTADCFRKYNNTNLLKEFSVPSISVSRLKSVKNYNFEIDGIQPINSLNGELQSCDTSIIDYEPSSSFSIGCSTQKVSLI